MENLRAYTGKDRRLDTRIPVMSNRIEKNRIITTEKWILHHWSNSQITCRRSSVSKGPLHRLPKTKDSITGKLKDAYPCTNLLFLLQLTCISACGAQSGGARVWKVDGGAENASLRITRPSSRRHSRLEIGGWHMEQKVYSDFSRMGDLGHVA